MIKGFIILTLSLGGIITLGFLKESGYINPSMWIGMPLIIISFFVTVYAVCRIVKKAEERSSQNTSKEKNK